MDQYRSVSDPEFQRLMQILKQNSDKTFVQRILRPDDFPKIYYEGGQATHRMSWGETEGKYVVFPTILWDGNNLKDYGDKAWDEVMKSGNYIEFDSADEADWFSKSYKGAWGGRPNNEPR